MDFRKFCLLLFASLFLFDLSAQAQTKDCYDVVYLKGGSVLRGQILEYTATGDLIMTSWSGAHMQMPAINVRKVTQKCKGEKNGRIPLSQRPYDFKEQGWYHAPRFVILSGDSGLGLGVQYSLGMKINRLLGVGVGLGIEHFDPYVRGVPTFPVFAELRGYLIKNNVSPYYALGLGYGLSAKNGEEDRFDAISEKWKGGWMGQVGFGVRIGKQLLLNVGIRLQQKSRTWENFSWGETSGIDRILHKRFDIGFGLLL